MRLYEFESKRLLKEEGIPTPPGAVVSSAAEAEATAREIGSSVVIKAQIPAGGRMKSGGVTFADSPEDARSAAERLLGQDLRGYRVEKLLVEQKVPHQKELYLAVTYDPAKRRPVAIASLSGGIGIEEVASAKPDAVVKADLELEYPFREYKAREVLCELDLNGKTLLSASRVLQQLLNLFYKYDATLAEINPLVQKEDGSFVALDAHVDIDEDALDRHGELEKKLDIPRRESKARPPTEFETKAAEIDRQDYRGVAGRLVEFDGNLGLIIGGGGASLTTFDAIRDNGGKPANYCEIGGNPSVRKVKELTKHILSKPGVEKIAVIMNIVNNTRSDLVARGVVKGVIEMGYDPADKIAVFRVPGAWEEEGVKILQKHKVPYFDRTVSIDEAARAAVERLR